VRKLLAAGFVCLGIAVTNAAPLNLVNVGAPAINCVFSTNCVVTATDTTNEITLGGTTGSGFLQTRTFVGGSNSPAAGLFGYEYRIDLRGITGVTNTQPCFTNVVRTVTNRVVVGFTNEVNCRTNPAGKVRCHTNRAPVLSNMVAQVTNTVPCPGTGACVQSLSVRFGSVVSGLNFDANSGTVTDQVYVVTSGGVGTIAPTSVTQSNGIVTFNFADPICPGESSFFFGLVWSNPPVDVAAVLDLTTGPNLVVGARAPGRARVPIPCDFNVLATLIANLDVGDIDAPNDNARRGRIGSIENRLQAAREAAAEGDIDAALEGLASIAHKAAEGNNTWITGQAGQMIIAAIEDLLNCIEEFEDTQNQ
jgi:hypothetical protein